MSSFQASSPISIPSRGVWMGGVWQMDVGLGSDVGGCPVWYPAGVCRCACGTSDGNASVCDVNECCASGNNANGYDMKWMWYVCKCET